MDIKSVKERINFKDKRYIIPLIVLFPAIYLIYSLTEYIDGDHNQETKQEFLSTSLGVVKDTILSKNQAYDKLYTNRDTRTMIQTIGGDDLDSMQIYQDDLSLEEKRFIDSLEFIRNQQKQSQSPSRGNQNYYTPPTVVQNQNDDKDYERSMEIIRMLNENKPDKSQSTNSNDFNNSSEDDPLKMMREQMFLIDSLEKANDPDYRAQLAAENRLKQNLKLKEDFLSNSFTVQKANLNQNFNTVSRQNNDIYIKAVIDEDIRGYLGSRIRFRLLDDVYIADRKLQKGSLLYANISGFSLQRVNLSIVSVLVDGEIYPINLSVYDIDGMKGMYVPRSQFREMMRELGQNSVQGTDLNESNSDFFQSLLSKAVTSSSQMIANMIRANKANLKYNSYIYLINEQELKRN